MVATLFMELLVFCVKITTPIDGMVEIHMVQDYQRVATVRVRRVNKRLDRLELRPAGGTPENAARASIVFIDNGLYYFRSGREKHRIDVARYFIKYYERQSEARFGPRTLLDTRGKKLYINPAGSVVIVSSPTEKISFVIPRKYLK